MDRRGFLWAGSAFGAGGLVWWQRNAIARAVLSRRVNAEVRVSGAPSTIPASCPAEETQ
ncbi:MAG: hypothetical protein OXP09_01865 [Gammaproteobacteria bacterium]|nr:hypothetical protein [Gammaproteobacteria bacterium]